MLLLLGTGTYAQQVFECESGNKSSGHQLLSRIVNGTQVNIELLPWQVALLDPNGFQFCGGSFISPSWVLTAAHCVKPGKQIFIGYGETNKTSLMRVEVIKQIPHPNWTGKATKGNDIAMLKLKSPVNFDNANFAKKAALFSQKVANDILVVGNCGTVSGWGTVKSGGSTSKTLLKASVPVTSRSACDKAYGFAIAKDQFCAGGDGKYDSCQGDSGGPFVIQAALSGTGNDAMLAGVVSWGNGCAEKGYPGVYTDVSYHYNWIMETYNAN